VKATVLWLQSLRHVGSVRRVVLAKPIDAWCRYCRLSVETRWPQSMVDLRRALLSTRYE
jgi:hypothetical protein